MLTEITASGSTLVREEPEICPLVDARNLNAWVDGRLPHDPISTQSAIYVVGRGSHREDHLWNLFAYPELPVINSFDFEKAASSNRMQLSNQRYPDNSDVDCDSDYDFRQRAHCPRHRVPT